MANFSERFQGALQIEKLAQQGLVPHGPGTGNQADGPSPPTLIHQYNASGGGGSLDFKALQPVQQFRR